MPVRKRNSSGTSPTTPCCTSRCTTSTAAFAGIRTPWRSWWAWWARSRPFYHDSTDISDPQQRIIASHRLIAKMPTIAAMAYKFSVGQPFVYPRNDLSYAENFLHMLVLGADGGISGQPRSWPAPWTGYLILHADHEQNASTSTVRIAGFQRRQSLRLHRRGHRLALGAGPWRRQRGGLADAPGNRLTRTAFPSLSSAPRTAPTPSG